MPVTTPVLVEQLAFGIKSETAYGTFSAPTTSDYLYVDKCDAKFESEDIARQYKSGDLNDLESAQGPVLMSFAVEGEYMIKSGSACPPMDAIERACGMTASTATMVTTYSGSSIAPTSFPGPGQSATILAYYRNELIAIKGAYGDYEEEHKSNGVITFKFTGKGLYQTWSTGTAPSPAYATGSYIRVSSSSLSVQAYVPEWSIFRVKYGNTVEAIPFAGDVTGYSRVVITKRRPTFEFDPLLPGTATHDYISNLVGKTKGAMTYSVGSVNGFKMAYSATLSQYTAVDVMNRNGVQGFNVTSKIIGPFTKVLQ